MPREPEKKSQVALNILLFYLSVGAIVAAAFALFPAQITGALNIGSLSPHLPLIGLAILLWLLTSPFEIFMVADGEVRAASVVIVILQVFKTGLLLAAALLSGDIQTILLAAVAYGVLQLVILGIWLRRRFKGFGWAPDWRLLGAQLANALPFGFGGLVYTAQYELHNYFISYYFDPAHFAI
jgi:O-antigen/teichoic acid export membrane protein